MCEYCEKGKRIEQRKNDNIYFEIWCKHLRVVGKVFCFPFARDVIINYCPKCGRKIGENKDGN